MATLYRGFILLDGQGNPSVTATNAEALAYEQMVHSWIDSTIQVSLVGRLILEQIRNQRPNRLRIIPIDVGTRNASAVPANMTDATDERAIVRHTRDDPATVTVERQGDPVLDGTTPRRGTGQGTHVSILYNPITWAQNAFQRSGQLRGFFPDDVLLHEMVHAMRMLSGDLRPKPFANPIINGKYVNLEEFYALMIANMYRSETGRDQPLRYSLGPRFVSMSDDIYLSDSQLWYQDNKQYVNEFFNDELVLAGKLSRVDCRFNPLREAVNDTSDSVMPPASALPPFRPERW